MTTMDHIRHHRAWWTVVALAGVLAVGCETATTEAPLVPPSTIPDPATVALLTGAWSGISTADGGAQDYLDFVFRPDDVHVRVTVRVNGSRLGEPYAEVTGDEVRIEVADTFGNDGAFVGSLDRDALRLEGTFTLLYNGTTEAGTFWVEKE